MSAELNSTSEVLPTGSEKVTEISLGQTSVKVKTNATPASIKRTKDLVQEKYQEFSDLLGKSLSSEQLSILVAFNLAEELIKEQERLRMLKKNVSGFADRLLDRVESGLQK